MLKLLKNNIYQKKKKLFSFQYHLIKRQFIIDFKFGTPNTIHQQSPNNLIFFFCK